MKNTANKAVITSLAVLLALPMAAQAGRSEAETALTQAGSAVAAAERTGATRNASVEFQVARDLFGQAQRACEDRALGPHAPLIDGPQHALNVGLFHFLPVERDGSRKGPRRRPPCGSPLTPASRGRGHGRNRGGGGNAAFRTCPSWRLMP